LLSCYDSWQLADLTVSLIPRIWAKQSKYTLSKYAIANTNLFRQFCYKLFKDTQISSGCVLLALYYLDQLKSIYPTLPNSELRLFTIALILANKYLDDNTFTNKTWSEVSGIPLRELNWMEMEYLDALDYSLHVHCFRFCSWVRQCECWISTPLVKR
ncbi:cyclin-domain-containing protein, partial [Chlamydoabsidia padenii]